VPFLFARPQREKPAYGHNEIQGTIHGVGLKDGPGTIDFLKTDIKVTTLNLPPDVAACYAKTKSLVLAIKNDKYTMTCNLPAPKKVAAGPVKKAPVVAVAPVQAPLATQAPAARQSVRYEGGIANKVGPDLIPMQHIQAQPPEVVVVRAHY